MLQPSSRVPAVLFSAALLALTLAPAAAHLGADIEDSFPFSTYPMFSQPRNETYRVSYAVAVAADGAQTRLSYRLAGAGGFNQVRRQIRRAARDGRADVLCTEIADRLAARGTGAVGVAVLTGRFDLRGYFRDAPEPVETEVHARCTVPTG
jgi:hypothetical protein